MSAAGRSASLQIFAQILLLALHHLTVGEESSCSGIACQDPQLMLDNAPHPSPPDPDKWLKARLLKRRYNVNNKHDPDVEALNKLLQEKNIAPDNEIPARTGQEELPITGETTNGQQKRDNGAKIGQSGQARVNQEKLSSPSFDQGQVNTEDRVRQISVGQVLGNQEDHAAANSRTQLANQPMAQDRLDGVALERQGAGINRRQFVPVDPVNIKHPGEEAYHELSMNGERNRDSGIRLSLQNANYKYETPSNSNGEMKDKENTFSKKDDILFPSIESSEAKFVIKQKVEFVPTDKVSVFRPVELRQNVFGHENDNHDVERSDENNEDDDDREDDSDEYDDQYDDMNEEEDDDNSDWSEDTYDSDDDDVDVPGTSERDLYNFPSSSENYNTFAHHDEKLVDAVIPRNVYTEDQSDIIDKFEGAENEEISDCLDHQCDEDTLKFLANTLDESRSMNIPLTVHPELDAEAEYISTNPHDDKQQIKDTEFLNNIDERDGQYKINEFYMNVDATLTSERELSLQSAYKKRSNNVEGMALERSVFRSDFTKSDTQNKNVQDLPAIPKISVKTIRLPSFSLISTTVGDNIGGTNVIGNSGNADLKKSVFDHQIDYHFYTGTQAADAEDDTLQGSVAKHHEPSSSNGLLSGENGGLDSVSKSQDTLLHPVNDQVTRMRNIHTSAIPVVGHDTNDVVQDRHIEPQSFEDRPLPAEGRLDRNHKSHFENDRVLTLSRNQQHGVLPSQASALNPAEDFDPTFSDMLKQESNLRDSTIIGMQPPVESHDLHAHIDKPQSRSPDLMHEKSSSAEILEDGTQTQAGLPQPVASDGGVESQPVLPHHSVMGSNLQASDNLQSRVRPHGAMDASIPHGGLRGHSEMGGFRSQVPVHAFRPGATLDSRRPPVRLPHEYDYDRLLQNERPLTTEQLRQPAAESLPFSDESFLESTTLHPTLNERSSQSSLEFLASTEASVSLVSSWDGMPSPINVNPSELHFKEQPRVISASVDRGSDSNSDEQLLAADDFSQSSQSESEAIYKVSNAETESTEHVTHSADIGSAAVPEEKLGDQSDSVLGSIWRFGSSLFDSAAPSSDADDTLIDRMVLDEQTLRPRDILDPDTSEKLTNIAASIGNIGKDILEGQFERAANQDYGDNLRNTATNEIESKHDHGIPEGGRSIRGRSQGSVQLSDHSDSRPNSANSRSVVGGKHRDDHNSHHHSGHQHHHHAAQDNLHLYDADDHNVDSLLIRDTNMHQSHDHQHEDILTGNQPEHSRNIHSNNDMMMGKRRRPAHIQRDEDYGERKKTERKREHDFYPEDSNDGLYHSATDTMIEEKLEDSKVLKDVDGDKSDGSISGAGNGLSSSMLSAAEDGDVSKQSGLAPGNLDNWHKEISDRQDLENWQHVDEFAMHMKDEVGLEETQKVMEEDYVNDLEILNTEKRTAAVKDSNMEKNMEQEPNSEVMQSRIMKDDLIGRDRSGRELNSMSQSETNNRTELEKSDESFTSPVSIDFNATINQDESESRMTNEKELVSRIKSSPENEVATTDLVGLGDVIDESFRHQGDDFEREKAVDDLEIVLNENLGLSSDQITDAGYTGQALGRPLNDDATQIVEDYLTEALDATTPESVWPSSEGNDGQTESLATSTHWTNVVQRTAHLSHPASDNVIARRIWNRGHKSETMPKKQQPPAINNGLTEQLANLEKKYLSMKKEKDSVQIECNDLRDELQTVKQHLKVVSMATVAKASDKQSDAKEKSRKQELSDNARQIAEQTSLVADQKRSLEALMEQYRMQAQTIETLNTQILANQQAIIERDNYISYVDAQMRESQLAAQNAQHHIADLESQLVYVNEEASVLQTTKDKLLLKAESWNETKRTLKERIRCLEEELKLRPLMETDLHTDITTNNTLSDKSRKEKSINCSHLSQIELDAQQQLEELKKQLSVLTLERENLIKEKRDAETHSASIKTKMEVLADYFHEKEAEYERKLAELRRGEINKEAENFDYSDQPDVDGETVENLKRRLRKQENDFRQQLTLQEKKAHESWLQFHQSEREASVLRIKVSSLDNRIIQLEHELEDVWRNRTKEDSNAAVPNTCTSDSRPSVPLVPLPFLPPQLPFMMPSTDFANQVPTQNQEISQGFRRNLAAFGPHSYETKPSNLVSSNQNGSLSLRGENFEKSLSFNTRNISSAVNQSSFSTERHLRVGGPGSAFKEPAQQRTQLQNDHTHR